RQERVAVLALGMETGRAGDRVQAEHGGEVLHLHRFAGLARTGIHLLKDDHVRVDLAHDLRDPRRIAPAVAAHAFVDVVGGDAQPPGRAGHLRLAMRRLSHHSAPASAAATAARAIRLTAWGWRTVAAIRSANTVSASTPGSIPIALPIR